MKQTIKDNDNIISVHFDAAFFFERGLRYFHRDDMHKALKYFQRCLVLAPEHERYSVYKAAVLTELGHYEQSNELLLHLVEQKSCTNVDVYFYIANNFVHLGDLEQAEDYVLHYLQRADGHSHYVEDAEELLDYICLELEKEPKTVGEEQQLIDRHEAALKCLEQGKFIEAIERLEQMAIQHPHFLAARNNLALAYYYKGEFQKAVHMIHEILEKDTGNLHALCNLAIFYGHHEAGKEVPIVEGLKKVVPLNIEHAYKLATTLGVLGEDERAYELFSMLIKRGDLDISLHHYVAVAAYHTGRWKVAEQYWRKVKKLDPSETIADYYLHLLHQTEKREAKTRLYYQYQLPYDVRFNQQEWLKKGKFSAEVLNDPLVRSTLFWSLQHGDQDDRLQAIQIMQLIADEEVKQALRQYIDTVDGDNYTKNVAKYVLRQMGAFPEA